jgi:acetyltransferase
LFNYAEFQRKREREKEGHEKSPATSPKVDAFMHSGRSVLSEYTSKKVLMAYGVPCVREVLCQSTEEVVEAAGKIGYPVALKVISPQILHKTEAGVIELNVGNENTLKLAYKELIGKARTYDPTAAIEGVLCQKNIEGAVAEAIVGIIMDPYFGPAVVFGMGGVMVEIFKDRTIGIPPLSRGDARKMIERTKASQLLHGFRGSSKADLEALIETLVRVGRLAVDWADRIEALDINPLLIMPESQGVVAVDALLVLKKDN